MQVQRLSLLNNIPFCSRRANSNFSVAADEKQMLLENYSVCLWLGNETLKKTLLLKLINKKIFCAKYNVSIKQLYAYLLTLFQPNSWIVILPIYIIHDRNIKQVNFTIHICFSFLFTRKHISLMNVLNYF